MNKISIIVPVYNSKSLIEDLLTDLKKLKKVEIIFVDDGSTDHTLDFIKNYFKQTYDGIDVHFLSCSHQGVSHARNVGMKNSSSEWIMFIDADDRIEYRTLQDIIDNNNLSADVTSFTKNCKTNYKVEDKSSLLTELLFNLHDRIIPGPVSKVYKSSFLKKKKITFPEGIMVGEDMIFNLRVILESDSIMIFGKSFYLYRQNQNSVTKSKNYDIEKNNAKFVNELIIILQKNEEYEEVLKKAIINLWLSDSVLICRFQFSRKKLQNLKKIVLKEYSLKRILEVKFPIKKTILKWLLLVNAYGVVWLVSNLNKKAFIAKKTFIKI